MMLWFLFQVSEFKYTQVGIKEQMENSRKDPETIQQKPLGEALDPQMSQAGSHLSCPG